MNPGTTVKIRPHTRWQTLVTNGYAELVEPIPHHKKGGQVGVVTRNTDSGNEVAWLSGYEYFIKSDGGGFFIANSIVGYYSDDELEQISIPGHEHPTRKLGENRK